MCPSATVPFSKLINSISERHKAPLERWLREGASLKFVRDKKKGVRDIRSDHPGELKDMYSLLAIKARVKPPSPTPDLSPPMLDLTKCPIFFPQSQI